MEKPRRPCGACGKENAPLKCPCNAESYCGPECQKRVWLQHKEGCSVSLSQNLRTARAGHGVDSAEACQVCMTLADVYRMHGKFPQALEMCEQVLRISELRENNDKERIADTICEIGAIMADQGRYPEAHETLQKGLSLQRKHHGDVHANVADTRIIMALCHISRGQFDAAGDELTAAMEILVELARTDTSRNNMAARVMQATGHICMMQNQHREAIERYLPALEIFRGMDDLSNTSTTLLNVGIAYINLGMVEEATAAINEALPALQREHGENSPHVALAFVQIGDIYNYQDDVEKAYKMYKKAHRLLLRCVGKNHQNIGAVLSKLADIDSSRGDFEAALIKLKNAESIFRLALGDHHGNVTKIGIKRASCEKELGI
jgi:tetratricopeptide (TPR) repeat protein